jgi:phage/plasmid-like protein (TIGR03299 family)
MMYLFLKRERDTRQIKRGFLMPADFESGFFGSNTPAWHGLGLVVEGLLTADEVLEAAGIDWTVEKRPIYLDDYSEIPGYFANVRNTDNKTLGIVGNNYEPFQNSQAFDFFDQIVSRKEAIYETAGSLKGGKNVWVLAKLPGEIVVKGKDITNKYLLLSNSHDGSTGVQIKLTPQRVVCSNTLAMALKGGAYNIRHTESVHDKVREAAEVMGFANKMYSEMNSIYNQMANVQMKEDDIRGFLKRCLKKSEHSKKQDMTDNEFIEGGEKEEKETKALVAITRLIEEGAGTDIPGVKGTLWGTYNAITEYVDHHRNYRSDDARMENAMFAGSGMILKTKAYQESLKLLKV